MRGLLALLLLLAWLLVAQPAPAEEHEEIVGYWLDQDGKVTLFVRRQDGQHLIRQTTLLPSQAP